jgi:hypothetical protein
MKPLSESFYAEEKIYRWHSGYDWCEGATDEWDEEQDCHISSLLENSEVATHKNDEFSNNSIIGHQVSQIKNLLFVYIFVVFRHM